jgi:hypothetical protein
MDAPADGRRADPEHTAALVGTEPQPLDKQERLALARWKPREDAADLGSRFDLGRGIDARCGVRAPSQRVGEVPETVPVQVEGGPIHVAHGRLHRPDPVPSLERAGERFLRQVLGLALAARNEDERTHDRGIVLPEEGSEGVPARGIQHQRSPWPTFDHAVITLGNLTAFGSCSMVAQVEACHSVRPFPGPLQDKRTDGVAGRRYGSTVRTVRILGPHDQILRTLVPQTRRERMLGLLGRSTLGEGEALLLERARSIHTYGMRFAIVAVLLDRDLIVRRVRSIPPGRLLLPRPGIRHVLECGQGVDLRPGDRIRVANAD